MFRYISMVALLFCSCRVYSEDFQITQIKSSNVLYRYWATRHLHKKGNNIITISFEDSLAYVSYKGENRRVLFFQSPHGRYTYYKNKYGLTAYLRLDSTLRNANFTIVRKSSQSLNINLVKIRENEE